MSTVSIVLEYSILYPATTRFNNLKFFHSKEFSSSAVHWQFVSTWSEIRNNTRIDPRVILSTSRPNMHPLHDRMNLRSRVCHLQGGGEGYGIFGKAIAQGLDEYGKASWRVIPGPTVWLPSNRNCCDKGYATR